MAPDNQGGDGMTAGVLAIDQGTTSTRAILFDAGLAIKSTAQREFPQHFPESGWVEHDPEDLWTTTVETCSTISAGPARRAPGGRSSRR